MLLLYPALQPDDTFKSSSRYRNTLDISLVYADIHLYLSCCEPYDVHIFTGNIIFYGVYGVNLPKYHVLIGLNAVRHKKSIDYRIDIIFL